MATSQSQPACNQCRARKVRCDREQPVCSNCAKASVACDFHNKNRRVNLTKQLVQDFSHLSDRLESIDATITQLTRRLDRGSRVSRRHDSPNDDDVHFDLDDKDLGSEHSHDGDLDPDPHFSTLFHRPGSSTGEHVPGYTTPRVHSVDQSGSESYFGPTSAPNLLSTSRAVIKGLIDRHSGTGSSASSRRHSPSGTSVSSTTSRQSWSPEIPADFRIEDREIIRALQDLDTAFPYPGICTTISVIGDGKAVSRPPQAFVETAVELYLAHDNSVMPIFEDDRLRQAVKEHYSDATSSNSDAWSLCFNNIIVLTMGSKLRASRMLRTKRSDLDDDLFASFLTNSRRAFDTISDYNEAKLINVQALLTLALVAADNFPYSIFERLVQRTSYVAREMGLHHSSSPTIAGTMSNGLSAVDKERRRSFWCLYTLDKMRTFLTGNPCNIHLFDADTELPTCEQGTIESVYTVSKVQIMSLWEEIWIGLYSSKAMRCSPKQIQHRINKLTNQLRDCATHFQDQVEKLPIASHKMELATCLRLELQYCRESSSQQTLTQHARAALQIITDVVRAADSSAAIALLSRLFRLYSFVPFYELHQRLLFARDDSSLSDLDLLFNCLAAARRIEADDVNLYHSKIIAGMQWCLLVNKALYQANGYSLPASLQQSPASAMLGEVRFSGSQHLRSGDMSSDASMEGDSMEHTRSTPARMPRNSVTSLSTMSVSASDGQDGTSHAAPILPTGAGVAVPQSMTLDDPFDFSQPIVPHSQLLDASSMPYSFPGLDGPQQSAATLGHRGSPVNQFDRDFLIHTPGFATFNVDLLAPPQQPQQASTTNLQMLLDTGPRDTMYLGNQWGSHGIRDD